MTLALSALDIAHARHIDRSDDCLVGERCGSVALIPSWHPYRGVIAFGFGLVHGFGFANVLFS